jgi:Trypsin
MRWLLFTSTVAACLLSAVAAAQHPPQIDSFHLRRRSLRELGPVTDLFQNIVGGNNVTTAISYFVKLADVAGNNACGGSLIAADIVLTAAHCIQDNSSAPVVWPNAVFIAPLTDTAGVNATDGTRLIVDQTRSAIHPKWTGEQ